MSFNHGLKPGDILSNDQIYRLFKCASQGGMRPSNEKNALVLISDHTKSLYEDWWEGDIFYYTGMGTLDDQSLDYKQNKKLAESNINGIDVYLFEVFIPKKYTFIGQMTLVDDPFPSKQLDKDNKPRRVWIFPLQLADSEAQPYLEDIDIIKKKEEYRQKNAEKKTDDDLKLHTKYVKEKPSLRQVKAHVYLRDPYIAEYAKRWAHGICQLCEQEAPFYQNDKPFLHTHHIVWLSKGGEDTIQNTIALCPNCHAKVHALDLKKDVNILRRKVTEHLKTRVLSN